MVNELKVKTTYGKGILYVTDQSFVIEIEKKGNLLELLHTQIALLEAVSKNKIKVTWPEGRQLHNFEFKTDNAAVIVKEIVEKYDYEKNFPDLLGVTSVLIDDKEKKKVIAKRLEINESNMEDWNTQLNEANLVLNMISDTDPDKQNKILEAANQTRLIHNEIEMCEKYKEDIQNIPINRSKKIPESVPNHRCWNDTWYDEDSNCLLTFNEFWEGTFKDNELVKQFEITNTIPNVYAIPYDNSVRTIHGYPAYAITTKEGNLLFTIIPSLNDDMITEEMISEKHGIEYNPNQNYVVRTIKKIVYITSEGSRLMLKNGQRYKLTLKETRYFLQRNMIPEEEKTLLP